MVETLVLEDYVVSSAYFMLVLAIGIWATCRPNKGSTTGYFLVGKNMTWFPIAAAIYASNLGVPMFVGLAGTAAASGFAVVIFEWHAVYFLVMLGWIFVPVYIASGAYTMPEYLKKRFGGKRIRIYASILSLVEYILHNISAEIYAGGVLIQRLLGWDIYLCAFLILAVTALYNVAGERYRTIMVLLFINSGGLTAVLYTDSLQAVVILGGAISVTVFSLLEVGGWSALYEKYPTAVPNYTLTDPDLYQCSVPRDDAFHIWRGATDGDIPWTGAILGLSVMGLFTWCQDQVVVQMCLSAKNMTHAKAGAIFSAFLKLFGFILVIVPGMISRVLYPDDVACADPDECEQICGIRQGCTNLAYPLLVLRLLPKGLKGLMVAAMCTALVCSLTGIFNSCSTIMTLDIWTHFRHKAKETELMLVGRVTVLVLCGISILWLPIMQQANGGILWFYLQAVKACLIVPWAIVFILGFFWKRTTEQAAFWGLMVGLVIGIARMALDFSIMGPTCGSGEPDRRFSLVSKVDFLHFATILSVVSTLVMVGISVCTKPRSEKQLHRVTFWTRKDEDEPELTDNEDCEEDPHTVKNEVKMDTNIALQTITKNPDKISTVELNTDEPNQDSRRTTVSSFCKNWLCGTVEHKHETMTRTEKLALRQRFTCIHESETSAKILNVLVIILWMFTAFLFGYFG